ncbi:MAG: phosphatase PAP2 family protein [Planctomycetota bacterium]|nr:phosphatase PAP2 family protein [Planctomycetota bacterium]
MSTLERIWVAYLVAVISVALLADGGGGEGHLPWAFVGLHGVFLLAQFGIAWLQPRCSVTAMRAVRATMALIGLPVVFSALAWLLPDVHPEPFEYRWYALDLALFGEDASHLLADWVPASSILPLQVAYSSFYLLPIVAALLVAHERSGAAYDRAVVILVGGFLISYLGYLLVPTLAPKVVLPELGIPGTDGLAGVLRASIDAAEANPWDCFPSGHTWLSITSGMLVVRWAGRYSKGFLPVVVVVVASTVILRYHWPIDVAVGALMAWPAMRLCDWLMDRDGAPSA